MEEITNILKWHSRKTKSAEAKADSVINDSKSGNSNGPSSSEIPDMFFDDILVNYKLTRIEIMVMMYLYRRVWCRPNINKLYGISDIMAYEAVYKALSISRDDLYSSFVKLEGFGFIETIRSGQYFVRKYFTQELDKKHGQSYDNFL
jgi:hypothetical protein